MLLKLSPENPELDPLDETMGKLGRFFSYRGQQ